MRKPEEIYIVKYRLVRGRLQPMLRFALSKNGQTVTVAAYVDSGATCSLFYPGVAEKLGIEYKSYSFQLRMRLFPPRCRPRNRARKQPDSEDENEGRARAREFP